MKALILASAILCVIALTSCESFGDFEDEKELKTPDYAPEEITGKALVLFNPTMKYTLRASSFTTEGTCKVPMLISDFIPTVTPTYNYTKTQTNNASLVVKYAYKYYIGSYTYNDLTFDVALTFTSESGGTYTGTEKFVSTGVILGNSNSTSDIYGTFTMY